MTILDLAVPKARDARAILNTKRLGVRLSFRLFDVPLVRAISTVGRGNQSMMQPTLLVIEYVKNNDDGWELTVLRVYGHMEGDENSTALNIYPHDDLASSKIPAWIRDAALDARP